MLYFFVPVTYPQRFPCYPVGAPQVISVSGPGYLQGLSGKEDLSDTGTNSAVEHVMDPSRCIWRIEVNII